MHSENVTLSSFESTKKAISMYARLFVIEKNNFIVNYYWYKNTYHTSHTDHLM